MAERMADNTWQENPADIIVIANRTANNYILDLPTGRYRLDAGRKMRTLKSILNIAQVKNLVDQGHLTIEAKSK